MFLSAGDVYIVDFGEPFGVEQGGIRPAIIVSNASCCMFSDFIYVAPITSQQSKSNIPEHYTLTNTDYTFLNSPNNIVLGEQCRPIDKSRLKYKIGEIQLDTLYQITKRIKINFIWAGNKKWNIMI